MPLRILLPAIGSSGDVHPVIALGRALRLRGHAVEVAANEYFCEPVTAAGLGFVALGTRAQADAIMKDPRLWHPHRGFECIVDHALLPHLRSLDRMSEERRGPSLVVAATTLCLGARVAQERLGVATATLHLQPSVFRSHVDSGRLSFLNLGPGMPRAVKTALFWLIDAIFVERAIAPELNGFRATLGLPSVRGVFSRYVHSPQLVLGLFPDWFAPAQADWPGNTHLTGFLMHDDGGLRDEQEEAEAFLSSGPPPVVVTPGSATMDRGEFFARTAAACHSLGLRAMLVTNHAAQLPASLPPGIRAFSYLPFSRILPKAAAIVYHGGIGTLAQAVRAAVPHLIVANAHDQPDNGQRIERLGLGRWVGSSRYRAGRAARLVSEIIGSAEIRQRCREFAPRIDSAASLERACALIEGLG